MTDIEHPHRTLNAYLFAPLGAFSGALYGLVQFGLLDPGSHHWAPNALKYIGAGLFYGIIVGWFLRRELDWHPWKWPAFVVAASASYAVAFVLTIELASRGASSDLEMAGIGALAGGVGALLLDLATAALSRRGRHLKFLVSTALIGAVLGAPVGQIVEAESVAVWMAFFAVWQTAYAGWSAMTLSRRVFDTADA